MRNVKIMESTQILKLTLQEDGVALVEIHRPEARNALNLELRQALSKAFQALNQNTAVRAIVITGGEKVFAAGADIKDFTTATTAQMYLRHTEQYWQSIIEVTNPI